MTVKKTIIGNYTPHSVMIVADGKVVLTIPSSGGCPLRRDLHTA